MGVLVTDRYIENIDPVAWDGKGRLKLTESTKEWAAKNAGKLYKASNGRLYEVVGTRTDKRGFESLLFRDAMSDILTPYTRGTVFPEV